MIYLSSVDGKTGEVAIDDLLAKHGPLEDVSPVDEDLVAARLGLVPNLLIDIWRAHGTGGLHNGGLWLIAELLDHVAERIFAGDPELAGTQIVAYGAMGNLLCWNARHGVVLLSPPTGSVQASGLMRGVRPDPDGEMLEHLRDIHPFFFDRVDRDNQPMLERARSGLGPLRAGQVYAAYPVQTMGHGTGIEDVVIDDAATYFAEVAMRTVFMLHDPEGGRFNIRQIGAPE